MAPTTTTRISACEVCRELGKRRHHPRNHPKEKVQELIELSDDESSEAKTPHKRVRNVVDPDDDDEDEASSAVGTPAPSKNEAVTDKAEPKNENRTDSMGVPPRSGLSEVDSQRPYDARSTDVEGWSFQDLIHRQDRIRLLMKMLLLAGPTKRELLHVSMVKVGLPSFGDQMLFALQRLQDNVAYKASKEHDKIILLCARMYLVQQTLDLGILSGKAAKGVLWGPIMRPEQRVVFVQSLERLLMMRVSKLFVNPEGFVKLQQPAASSVGTVLGTAATTTVTDPDKAVEKEAAVPTPSPSLASVAATGHNTSSEQLLAFNQAQQSNFAPHEEACVKSEAESEPENADEATVSAIHAALDARAGSILHNTSETTTMTAVATPTATESHVATIVSIAKCSEDEARRHLQETNGDVQQAMLKSLMPATILKAEEEVKEPRPRSLIDEALDAYTQMLQKLQLRDKGGDVLIILDLNDLQRTCRVRSDDLAELSTVFAELLVEHETEGPDGVQHLLVLAKNEFEMPVLTSSQRQRVGSPLPPPRHHDDTCSEFLTASQTEDPAGRARSDDTTDHHRGHHQRDAQAADWVSAYESTLRIIARFKTQLQNIPPDDIAKALPKIELISRITQHYDAAGADSPITRELESRFSGFINSHQLWEAIAKDAARWLILGVRLQSSLVYNEAFVHVAGGFPVWPWPTPAADVHLAVPQMVNTAILARNTECKHRRLALERELMFVTITGLPKSGRGRGVPVPVSQRVKPVTWSVVNIWRDWLTSHLAHLDSGVTGPPDTHDPLCEHKGDECLTVAGLYRIISRGGDAYLSPEFVIENYWDHNFGNDESAVRSALRELKRLASEAVAPLLKSALQYDAKDTLPYLTCIEIEAGDVPWQKNGLKSEVDADGDLKMS